ncbi:ribose ABC transporter substrate-binding protein RbsB [Staphylospora marina]|uniref:ribose ABC transporter substrate-binding protein RbsB n=1 Tax=Staphylospora marina TaxID=2490858 RepID=UPI000F5B8DE2|nr:ribose ABC transporter substrate-binding protein RbsB [Staphylospora marina]
MKRLRLFALCFLLAVLVVTGCSTKSSLEAGGENQNTSDDKITIGLSVSTLNNPFFVTLKDGAEQAAKAAGAELVVADAQDDTAKQLNDVEDLIQKKVDLILLNPTDSKAASSAVEAANKAGIPVITVDRAAEGKDIKILSHIASDNVAGGQLAGEFILQKLGGKGKIAELEGLAGTSAAHDRGKGFHQAVDGKPGVEIVAKQPADFNRAKGLSVMENILQSHPDIQAVFAHNDEMALGALEAVKAAKKQILIVGFDATEDAVKAVNAGELAATVAQKPADMGKMAVETALKALKGEKVDAYYPVQVELVTKK